MGKDKFDSDRLVLRERSPHPEVMRYAEDQGWLFIGEIPEQSDEGTHHQISWSVGTNLHVHYLEDPVSRAGYLIVSGSDPNMIASLAREIELELESWSLDELIDAVDTAEDSRDKARLVVHLGIAAPLEFNGRIFENIARALQHEEEAIRHAALWATSFSPWPQYRAKLAEVAREDPSPELKEAAKAVLEGFDATGVDGP